MSKKQIIIPAILAVICVVIYITLGFFKQKPVEETVYPESGLSNSIFDYQNMVHTSVSGMDSKFSFQNMPFTVDVTDGARASVGDATVIEKSGFYFVVGEIAPDILTENYISAALTSVVEAGGDVLATTVTKLDAKEGYINGCLSKYALYEMKTGSGKTMYIAAMRLSIYPSIYDTETELVIGCMSGDNSNEGLSNIQGLAEAVVRTLAVDKEHLKKLEGK